MKTKSGMCMMQISAETRNKVIMAAVHWGMSWDNAEKQLDEFLDGDSSINTAQIQTIVNRMWFK